MDAREELARAISDARLWGGAWDKMGEPERNQFRQMAEGVLASPVMTQIRTDAEQAGMLRERERCAAIFDAKAVAASESVEELIDARDRGYQVSYSDLDAAQARALQWRDIATTIRSKVGADDAN